MKTRILILLIFTTNFIFSQNDRAKIISVKGSSTYLVSPKNIKIDFSISDVQPNEYRKTRYKKQSEVYNEFIDKLKQIGITNTMKASNVFTSNYWESQNQETEYYYIIVKDFAEAKLVIKNFNDGVKITNINYLYDAINDTIKDSELSKAIKDAKDKASIISKKVNKKVGEVISINFLSDTNIPSESRTLLEDITTSVNITFELL